MSAYVAYWVRIPKITYEWIEVSGLSKPDVREDFPDADEVLTQEELEERIKNGQIW
jgi:hypothetical protein